MRLEKFTEGEFYHIYNRGNSKKQIFHDAEDYERFKKFLYLCNSNKKFNFRDDIIKRKIDAYDFEKGGKLVNVCLYVLMPNHFHICLTPALNLVEGVEKFMLRLSGAYSRYYNAKYKRTGNLFEGTFKAKHLSNDQYIKYIFAYIHLNPIKLIQKDWKENGIKNILKVKSFLNSFEYSSYRDYLNLNNTKSIKILEKDIFKKIIPAEVDLEKYLLFWLTQPST